MKKRSTNEKDFLLDNIAKVKENIIIVRHAELTQTGFSSEKNRNLYVEGCKIQIVKYKKRLIKLGYTEQKKLAL